MDTIDVRNSVSCPHVHSGSGHSRHDGRHAFHHWNLWNGSVFGEQAAQRAGNPHGSRRATQRSVASSAGTMRFKLLAIGSAAGMVLGILAGRVLASIVYQATPRDPVVLVGVVLAMAALGLLATWIPAQRALSGQSSDPVARRLRQGGFRPEWADPRCSRDYRDNPFSVCAISLIEIEEQSRHCTCTVSHGILGSRRMIAWM